MGDARSLRTALSQTDMTAPRIQASAASMMRMYSVNPNLAVSEWRNILQSCQNSQLLPLLYVANEVLQTSKRNRGNKFLEAFGPVLGGSLRYMCERDPGSTEKVRRTAKIWGDRRVFSLRFVGDLLAGLENYRNGGTSGSGGNVNNATSGSDGAVPQAQRQQSASNTIMSSGIKSGSNANAAPSNDDSDSDGDLFRDDTSTGNADTSTPAGDTPFGDSGPSLLNVSNFSIPAAVAATPKPFGAGAKRRRNSGLSPAKKKRGKASPTGEVATKPKRPQKLSLSNFMELIQQLENLEAQFQSITTIISSIKSASEKWDDGEEIMEVGDELTDLHTDINRKSETLSNQRKILHDVAEQKRVVELTLKRYLTWMQKRLIADQEESTLCDGLEEKLTLLHKVHADAKKARDVQRAKELEERLIREEAERKKKKEEELQRSIEQIQRKDGPKEGMVWNKQAREYQYLADATEESWRD